MTPGGSSFNNILQNQLIKVHAVLDLREKSTLYIHFRGPALHYFGGAVLDLKEKNPRCTFILGGQPFIILGVPFPHP